MNTLRREQVGELAAVSAVLMWTTAAGASPSIVSDFETDLDGWTVNNATPVHVATGGNPGGYMFFDNPENTITRITAPPKFRGDLRAFQNGTLAFDGNLLLQLAPNFSEYGTVTISGTAGSLVKDIVPNQPPVGQWLTHSLTLTPANFGVTQQLFDAILQNVTNLTIVIEAAFGEEQNGVDNVRLTMPALTGDLNCDGFVGIADLNIVLGNWNTNVTPGVWLDGDPSGDGFVGIDDLNAVLGNWNAGTPPAAAGALSQVPEPGMASVLGLFCCVMAGYRSGNRLAGFG